MKPLSEIQKEVEKVLIEVMAYAFEKGKEDDDFVGKEEKAKAKVWADRLLALIRSDREEMEKMLEEIVGKKGVMFFCANYDKETGWAQIDLASFLEYLTQQKEKLK